MNSNHTATMTLDTVAAFDTTATFVIPLVALLITTSLMWHEEHHWNFSALQTVVHLSNLVYEYLHQTHTWKTHHHLGLFLASQSHFPQLHAVTV
jgi:hypothetical protein